MRVFVHSAAIQDRDSARLVLDRIRRRLPWLEMIWADGGYNARQVAAAVTKVPVLRMEIVKRSDVKGFVVLPRRWVVERIFSWLGRNRRLAKDFENLAGTLATFVNHRLHPARPPVAGESLAKSTNQRFAKWGDHRGPQKGGEEAFAETRGNGGIAPIPAIRASAQEWA